MQVFAYLDALDILNTAQVNISMYSCVDSLFGLGGGDGQDEEDTLDKSTIATFESGPYSGTANNLQQSSPQPQSATAQPQQPQPTDNATNNATAATATTVVAASSGGTMVQLPPPGPPSSLTSTTASSTAATTTATSTTGTTVHMPPLPSTPKQGWQQRQKHGGCCLC
jgi:hypothetical protein